MSRPVSNLRLFVAIYPPVSIAQAIVKTLGKFSLPSYRATAIEQLHLTVQFIGDVPQKNLSSTIESVNRAASGVGTFALQPLQIISLPQRGAIRLLAVETDAPSALMELHRRLVGRLARSARDRDQHRFRPHFTVCRFNSPHTGAKIEHALQLPAFSVQRIALMRSTLTREGAEHYEVTACELAG